MNTSQPTPSEAGSTATVACSTLPGSRSNTPSRHIDNARPRSPVAREIQSHSGETCLHISSLPSRNRTRSRTLPDAPRAVTGVRATTWSESGSAMAMLTP